MKLLPSNPSAQTVFHMNSREDQMIFGLFPGSSSSFQDCFGTARHLMLLFQWYHSSPWRESFLIFPQVMPYETRDDPYSENHRIDKGVESGGNPDLKRPEASFHCSSPTYSSARFDIIHVEYCSVFFPGRCRHFTPTKQKYAQSSPASPGQGGIQNPRVCLTVLSSSL